MTTKRGLSRMKAFIFNAEEACLWAEKRELHSVMQTFAEGNGDRMNNSGNTFGRFLLLWSGQLVSAHRKRTYVFWSGGLCFQDRTGKASSSGACDLAAFYAVASFWGPAAGVLADRYDPDGWWWYWEVSSFAVGDRSTTYLHDQRWSQQWLIWCGVR
jgi:hypothetical protein